MAVGYTSKPKIEVAAFIITLPFQLGTFSIFVANSAVKKVFMQTNYFLRLP